MCICAILQYGNSICRSNSRKRLCRSNSNNSNVAATVAIVAHVVNQASNTVHTLRTQNLYFCSKNLCIFLGQCGWILACGKTLLQLKIYICKDNNINNISLGQRGRGFWLQFTKGSFQNKFSVKVGRGDRGV